MYIFLNVLVLVVFIAGAVGFYRAGALREIVSHLDEDSPSLERRKERGSNNTCIYLMWRLVSVSLSSC
ncbi:MAG TPA: hypothetical protein P5274_02515 [Candidatus Paceibacterota bacterium]|nr:hypothetical protein [Candidatus Paceibacterota bacterium]